MRGKGVAYMRGLAKRGTESGAEGCGVERRDGSVGERKGSEIREREVRIG